MIWGAVSREKRITETQEQIQTYMVSSELFHRLASLIREPQKCDICRSEPQTETWLRLEEGGLTRGKEQALFRAHAHTFRDLWGAQVPLFTQGCSQGGENSEPIAGAGGCDRKRGHWPGHLGTEKGSRDRPQRVVDAGGRGGL